MAKKKKNKNGNANKNPNGNDAANPDSQKLEERKRISQGFYPDHPHGAK